MTDLSRRDFFRGLPGRVAAVLGSGAAAAPPGAAAEGAARPSTGDISARDLRKMSRAEVRQALRRLRTQRRAR